MLDVLQREQEANEVSSLYLSLNGAQDLGAFMQDDDCSNLEAKPAAITTTTTTAAASVYLIVQVKWRMVELSQRFPSSFRSFIHKHYLLGKPQVSSFDDDDHDDFSKSSPALCRKSRRYRPPSDEKGLSCKLSHWLLALFHSLPLL